MRNLSHLFIFNNMDKLEMFLKKAKSIHPNLDFTLVKEIVNYNTPIKVICHEKDYASREHGIFEITPYNLLNNKSCPKCKGKKFTSEDRRLFCSLKHKGKYDYSKSDFSKVKEKTTVICPIHGEFKISYDHHFNNGIGCKYCSYPSRDTDSFIEEAIKVHNGFYTYDKEKLLYKNAHDNVIITCPIHGDFLQSPNAHLRGQGCPKCACGRIILEDDISRLLDENNIVYERNKRPIWLKTHSKGQLSLDFYLSNIKLAIECQGKQHFGLGGWSKNYNFEKQFERDKWKLRQCKENDVELIYFANKNEAPKYYIGEIFTDKTELMKYIKYLYKNNE